MQGLSGIRLAAHCSFPCSGRSLAAKQHLVRLGFQQPSSSLKCRKNALTPTILKLKSSLQDGAATENGEVQLGEEEVSGNLAAEELTNGDVALIEGPKVTAKFILEKKCYFGQRFNVVGNDPLFGSWDVEAAIPMQWADGDTWTVEVEVPAGKQFEFKFVLTGDSGEAVWQPGSNRVLNTEEGFSPLVVNEAWDSLDEVAELEVGKESSDPVQDATITTSTETDGLSFPTEDAAKEEVVKALESIVDPTDEHSTPSESDVETAPELPVAELDVVATAVKSAVGVDDTA